MFVMLFSVVSALYLFIIEQSTIIDVIDTLYFIKNLHKK